MSRVLVFDSGVGGLSIVESIREKSASVAIDYAADSGFFPYGLKTDQELKERLPMLCGALVEEVKPDLLVMACNTASTLALNSVRERVNIPVVGTVPAIKPAVEETKTGVIGVLATPGTVRRHYLDELEKEFASDVKVLRHGTSGLVELAERYVRDEELSPEQFEAAVLPLFFKDDGSHIDTVVLACTHFPLIREQIKAACPKHVKNLIDSGEAIARQVIKLLKEENTKDNSLDTRALLTGGRANKAAYSPTLEKYGYSRVDIIDL